MSQMPFSPRVSRAMREAALDAKGRGDGCVQASHLLRALRPSARDIIESLIEKGVLSER